MSRTQDWVPRGALAFLLVAVLVVVGVAIVRPSWFGDGEGPDGPDVPADRAFDKTLLDLGSEDGVRLSDDTGTSQSFTVPVPVDSRLEEPVLSLEGRTQVAGSSTVFLRVLADGVSVHVAELPEGDRALAVDVELPDSATADGEVEVQVRTTGSLDQRRCNLTTEIGALVVLDPDRTRLHGELDERLHTVRDVVAELDHDLTLVLAGAADTPEWFETAARLGAFLTQQGHDVSYAEELPEDDGPTTPVLLGPADALDGLGWTSTDDTGSVQVGDRGDDALLGVVEPAADVVPTFLTTSAVTTADAGSSDPTRVDPQRPGGDRVGLETLGADTAVQQITDRRSWRVPYSLADLPGGSVPTALSLRMLVPPTTDDARWLVQVRLDDELVDSVRLPGIGRQVVTADLPTGRELVRNELVVTLVRDRDLGGCNVRQTPYDVQLLPGSALVLGGQGAGLTAVPADFSGGFDVLLPTAGLEDPTVALAGLVPTLAEFSGWRQRAAFAWDGAPAGRPFLLLGEPPPGVTALVDVAGGRISADGFDLTAFEDGVVVQRVSADGTPGLVVTPVGDPDAAVPAYGREEARLVTSGGGGFVVAPTGRVVSVPPVRAETGG